MPDSQPDIPAGLSVDDVQGVIGRHVLREELLERQVAALAAQLARYQNPVVVPTEEDD